MHQTSTVHFGTQRASAPAMRLLTILSAAILATTVGCAQTQTDDNVPEAGPPPIAGGTLAVTRDGRWAIASDPARASIHVVDLERRAETARITLGPRDEPGRVAEDLDGGVHVVLRRAGEIAHLDPAGGRLLGRSPVCAAPRGIAVDPDDGTLVVACAEGQLVRMSPDGVVVRRVNLVHDLRDVVAQTGGRLWVSRFRSAQVLKLEGERVVARIRPPIDSSLGSLERTPTVAWRMRGRADGGVILVHQQSQSTQLGTLRAPGAVYYGGDCISGVVRSVVTTIRPDGLATSLPLQNASLAVDVIEQGGATFVAAASEPGVARDSESFVQRTGALRVENRVVPTNCRTTSDAFGEPRPWAATALARTPGGQLIAQYRDPARLVIDGETIELRGGSVEDFGHALFHEAAGTGVTCASCHPEGTEDGHVWLFDIGTRRTQTLTGGISATAPFHWAGDVPDVTRVLDGTFVGRMAGSMPRADEVDAFMGWMDALPALPGPAQPSDAVARGRAVFEEARCDTCHSGPLRTNNETMDVGTGGSFQVPALYEIVYHAPYLHDGSGRDLDGLIASHGSGGTLSTAQRGDLVTYLRSL